MFHSALTLLRSLARESLLERIVHVDAVPYTLFELAATARGPFRGPAAPSPASRRETVSTKLNVTISYEDAVGNDKL